MANVKTEIKKIEFIIKEDVTHCNLLYSSDEPGSPAWGGGWKTKTFGKSKSIVDFINEEAGEYLMWPSGRQDD